ncbi:MAG: hypothetical protein JNM17_13860 [Archangium sp.]|nr:hypothetical protein [Archangium sp.]
MSSITGTSSKRLELVRSTSFKSEADGGKTLEVAMAVSVFKKLQDAGLIDPKTKLSDKLEKTSSSKATSYEARLVELIRDTNANGKLEVDLEALSGSGMLNKSASVETLTGVLEGRTSAVPDAFISKQSDKSKLGGARGSEVQNLTNGMVLRNEVDAAAMDALLSRASSDPKAVAKEAIAGAQVLGTKGKGAEARELLDAAGIALQSAGKFAEAREVFTVLTRQPHADVKRNLVPDQRDISVARNLAAHNSVPVVTTPAGNRIAVEPANFDSTVGAAAQLRLDQVALQERMTNVLGRPVDLKSISDASAYFQAFAKGKDAGAVSKEFGAYLKAGFKHSGEGTEWSAKIPSDERAGRLEELFAGQFSDDAGRRVIDCEGFAYLSDRLLGGIKNADGSNRFVVEYATKPGHVITGVSEPTTNALFTVNNDNVSKPVPAESQRSRREAIARELCGAAPNVIGISRKQSESEPVQENTLKPPRLGSLAWDGERIRGEIDPILANRFTEYANRVGIGASFGGFVASEFD